MGKHNLKSKESQNASSGNLSKKKAIDDLIRRIRDERDSVRAEAWQEAGKLGAAGLTPLAEVMKDRELEVSRAAKRGLWKIVRHTGRPGADDEKKEVIAELISLLGNAQPIPVRSEVLWMISEIGGSECVKPVAGLLFNKKLREDARMVLHRIPGKESLAALQTALKSVPKDFKLNIAQSLRQRGVKVEGLACIKLAPVKKTKVRPVE